MGLKIGHYFFLTRPATPMSEVDGFIFDTNLIGEIYDWFTSPKPDIEVTKRLTPILELLREKRLVHWQYGALEKAWAWQEVHEVTSLNYNRVNPHLFMQIGLCIHTLMLGKQSDFVTWIDPERNFSIPFMDRTNIPYFQEKMDHKYASELAIITNSAWTVVLLLFEAVESLTGNESVEELKVSFSNWKETCRGLGLSRYTDIELLAYMAFFGGTLSNDYYLNSYTTTVVHGPKQTAKELLKYAEWGLKGKAKIARNVAFDVLFFRRQLESSSGLKQEDMKFVQTKSEKFAIVTADKGMNALSAAVRALIPIEGQLYASNYQYPRDSKFTSEYPDPEDLGKFFSDLRYRAPDDRPTLEDLDSVLKAAIDRSIRPDRP
jgi:hypothetical protein